MPVSEKVYPDWVQQFRTRGTTVKKKGNSYYLYKRTSRYVPGKKYPQPVDTYIGIITPEGVVKTKKKKVELSNIIVKEYGFSKAVWELCPQEWKDTLDDEWEDVLKTLIIQWSPQSYLADGYAVRESASFHCSFSTQEDLLSSCIFKEHGVDMKELETLKTVYLVRIGKVKAVSRINEEQEMLLSRIGVKL